MDKKFEKALTNFAKSAELMVQQLENLVKEQNDSAKGIYSAITGKDGIHGTVKRIERDVKSIKQDVKELVKNQNQLAAAAKEKETSSESIFTKIGGSDYISDIKSGASMLILIAGGVVAIGSAFNLVGEVDPLTVLSIAFAIGIMSKAMVGLKQAGIPSIGESIEMTISLIAFTGGVVASAHILRAMPSIGISTIANFGLLTAAFVVASLGLSSMTAATKGVSWQDVLKVAAILPAYTAGVVLSSYLMTQYQPVDTDNLWNFVLFSGTMALTSLAMAIPMVIIGKMAGSMVKGAIASMIVMPALATAMVATAGIFTLGDSLGAKYDTYPSIGWSLSVTASMLSFTLGAAVVGAVLATGIGAVILGLGAVGIVGLAATIATTSNILSDGDYSYGSQMLPWSMAMGISFMSFIPAFIALGAISAIPFVGGKILESGQKSLIMIAATITATSHVLAKGNYRDGPTLKWASGTAISMAAFVPAFVALGAISAIPFAGNIIKSGQQAMIDVANTIVLVSSVFAENKANWGGYPTKEWSEGVGLAIGAFAPVYSSLNSSIGGILDSIFGRDTAGKMQDAMVTVAKGIISVDKTLAGHEFSQVGINKEWASSVAELIAGFSLSYVHIKDAKLTAADIEKYKPTLVGIAETISEMVDKLEVDEIQKIESLQDLDLIKISDGFDSLAGSIRKLNRSLNGFDTTKIAAMHSTVTAMATMSLLDYNNLDNVIKLASEKEDELSKLVATLGQSQAKQQIGVFSAIKKIFSGDDKQEIEQTDIQTQQIDESNEQILEALQRIETYLASITVSSDTTSKKVARLGKDENKLMF